MIAPSPWAGSTTRPRANPAATMAMQTTPPTASLRVTPPPPPLLSARAWAMAATGSRTRGKSLTRVPTAISG